MISIEAYRATVGRFRGKSTKSNKMNANQSTEVPMFLFVMTLMLLLFYGIVILCAIFFFYYMVPLILVAMYGYTLSIFCVSTDLLGITVIKMGKRDELMRKPSPSKGIKDHSLIPYNYLNTYVFDGRCSYGKGAEGKSQLNLNRPKIRKLFFTLTKCIQKFSCFLCNFIICTSCVNIALAIHSKMNNVQHINALTVSLELYSLCHLKLAQLLVDGDIEANPGPVDNNVDTTAITEHVPVPLQNYENVCFFNSVAQVFYSLLQFREHILNTTLDTHVITKLRQLFREMQSSQIVHTYPIVRDLYIPQYRVGAMEQIDAIEVVSYLPIQYDRHTYH